MNAEILSIGSELMAGRIADANAAFLSERLTCLGFHVTRHVAVGDRTPDIVASLRSMSERADVAIVTGGIGPTPDDVTRRAFARFAAVDLVAIPDAVRRLEDFFSARKRPLSPSNLIQARIPQGSNLIPNQRGTAAGFRLQHGSCEFYCLPGVPAEMQQMFIESVGPRLQDRSSGVTRTKRLEVFGLPESLIGERLAGLMGEDRNPEVATQACEGAITVRITATGPDKDAATEQLESVSAHVKDALGNHVFGEDGRSLAEAVAELLDRRSLTLAVAESCTGGEVCARLTDVPGISRHLIECTVTYSDTAKTRRLNVPPDMIQRHGAVSREVAECMADGMRESSGAALALGITGIAGPTGGKETKPVGLVYVALAGADGTRAEELRLGGSRRQIKDRAAKHALNFLRLHLEGQEPNHG